MRRQMTINIEYNSQIITDDGVSGYFLHFFGTGTLGK